jgi:hypothetical protein
MRVAIQKNFTHNFKLASLVGWELPTSIPVNTILLNIRSYVATYNSPMESCVVICRTQKPQERRGKILLIDAVKEVARVQAQSFLKLEHQKRILAAYRGFRDEEGFAKVVTVEQVSQQDYSLSVDSALCAGGVGKWDGDG